LIEPVKHNYSTRWFCLESAVTPTFYIWQDKTNDYDLVYAPLANKLLKVKPNYRRDVSNGDTVNSHELRAITKDLITQEISIEDLNSQSKKQKVHLSIGLSNNCPLYCIYCHAESSIHSAKIVQESLTKKAIDDAFQSSTKSGGLSVSFTAGGEPTFEWRLFQNTVNYINERSEQTGIPIWLMMTSNGVYGDTKRSFVCDHFDSVTLSIDGIPSVQNTQRPTRKHGPTFQTVWATAKFFIQRNLHFGIRSTVTLQSLPYMCQFVSLVKDELGAIPIDFEPVVKIGRASALHSGDLPNVDILDFCTFFWKAYVYGQQQGISVSTSMLNLKTLNTTMCGALSLPARTITSSGLVTACHRDNNGNFAYGRYIHTAKGWNYAEFSPKTRKRIARLSLPPKKCDHCFSKWNCCGGCPDLRYRKMYICDGVHDLMYHALRHKE
jgi:uncharacterized protein